MRLEGLSLSISVAVNSKERDQMESHLGSHRYGVASSSDATRGDLETRRQRVFPVREQFSWPSVCLWLRSGHLPLVWILSSLLYSFQARGEFPEKDSEIHVLNSW